VAARKVAAERPDLLWLHWVHSATTPGLLNTKADYLDQVRTKFPHSFVVFPNEYSRPRVARNFGYDEADVKCVPHPIDIPEFFNFHPVTKRLALEKNILGADLVMTLPARLDRGKQVEFPIRIAASAKQMGRSVRFICFDFHSTGDEKVEYREWLEGLARKRGLNEQEVTFMSQFDEETRVSAPRRMIRDMLMVSNAFVLPSRSETYSLVAQEAAACGNILVLNFDFPPMRDIYGSKHPLYAKFSSNIDAMTGMDGDTVVEYNPSVDTYCNDIAGRVLYEVENNRGIAMRTRTRKTRNLRYIFKNYLEPLLYAKKKGMKDDHE
jgi:glycosyltransferase involved in cell wall biosynthesis